MQEQQETMLSGYSDKEIFDEAKKREDNMVPNPAQSLGEMPSTKLYDAICSDCNKQCHVPFKPKEGWTIRCRECYAKFKGL